MKEIRETEGCLRKWAANRRSALSRRCNGLRWHKNSIASRGGMSAWKISVF